MARKYQLKQKDFSVEEEEIIIYKTIQFWLKQDSSERIIEQFRYLFIKGNGCEYPRARLALETIINLDCAQQEFNFIFSRCCQLIICEWQSNPVLRAKIPLFINQIALAKLPSSTQSRVTRKLRELVINFIESEQYSMFKRLGRLFAVSQPSLPDAKQNASNTAILSNLIIRYPYLYEVCLVGKDSSQQYKQTINKLQKKAQNRYELDLSRYITYRVRLIKIVRKYKAEKHHKIPKKAIQPVSNPTLLSDRQLDLGLRIYTGKLDSQQNLRSLAIAFRDGLSYLDSHQDFKASLLTYLTVGFDCEYSNKVIKPKLANYLDSILPNLHANKVDDFTLLRTCSLLLRFLIVDNVSQLNHHFLVEMVTQIGAIKVSSLLLKIVLICEKAKPYLEQRLGILFSHYDNTEDSRVSWLIEFLETMQLALSIHFGKVDLSLINII